MPKNEMDPDDPMELRGVAFHTVEDTSDAMTECFIEEFLRLGHGPEQVLALFRDRHYTGPNMVHQNRGEAYVRGKIVEVFGWWGCVVSNTADDTPAPASPAPPQPGVVNDGAAEQSARTSAGAALTGLPGPGEATPLSS